MDRPVARPTPEEIQPPLTPIRQAWRLAVCLVFSLLVWSQAFQREWSDHRTMFWFEVVLGSIAFVLVYFRRKAPNMIAAATALLTMFSGLAAGPATLAGVSMATHRRAIPIVGIGLLNYACAMAYTLFAPFDQQQPMWVSAVINLVVNTAMVTWGMYLGSRRELLWTLRQRALRAESDQELRVEQGRSQERERIAREMHDVLAHRITQISMQAGALAFRHDLNADQLRAGLDQIQNRSKEAIQELRGVLGVLRDQATGELIDQPQPTYDDLVALVEESRETGVNIQFVDDVDRSTEDVPDPVGRTLYRIIQEGLTNASKHAPGALVSIELTGSPRDGIDVVISNPIGFANRRAPGAGLGLVGLVERAQLRGGRLGHGREETMFVVRGWIPWTV